ncbi:putative quinol monooxygenase [Iodidimonas sp. SYSU 1G8]|uniref:putative quinol monooxygenase n=1 Tax=Iodidimonas sp. SYSU 1G8 TaxID=3133967 RepID=UPI0031FE9E1A
MSKWAIVAKIKVKEGKTAEFEAAAADLVKAVNANEPGCLFYELHRTDDPLLYVFVERYENEDAMKAHGQSAHFKELGPKMGAFMDGRPDIMRLPQV